MLGSLSEFIDLKKKIKIKQPPQFHSIDVNDRKLFSQQRRTHNSVLVYQTQSKSVYLNSIHNKDKFTIKKNRAAKSLIQSLQKSKTSIKQQKDGWVQNKPINKYKNINAKHKLLRAIIKTKQLQGIDIHKTAYDESIGRIRSAYNQIKMKPIDALLPPKLVQIQQILQKQQQIKFSPKKFFSGTESELVKLQNCVRWAKKHGQRVDNFYLQLGKSYELIDKQKPGKSNYSLQKQQRQKSQEQQRRGIRKKFLKQIQRRVSKYSKNQ